MTTFCFDVAVTSRPPSSRQLTQPDMYTSSLALSSLCASGRRLPILADGEGAVHYDDVKTEWASSNIFTLRMWYTLQYKYFFDTDLQYLFSNLESSNTVQYRVFYDNRAYPGIREEYERNTAEYKLFKWREKFLWTHLRRKPMVEEKHSEDANFSMCCWEPVWLRKNSIFFNKRSGSCLHFQLQDPYIHLGPFKKSGSGLNTHPFPWFRLLIKQAHFGQGDYL